VTSINVRGYHLAFKGETKTLCGRNMVRKNSKTTWYSIPHDSFDDTCITCRSKVGLMLDVTISTEPVDGPAIAHVKLIK